MTQPRYLTKSRFKLGCECPTKLFYTNKKNIYADQKLEDTFLQALADGGFQVGELAKHYFPGGIEIERAMLGDYDEKAAQTRALIDAGNVTLYEAAIQVDNFFIYTDILVRDGNTIYLYEVKAKSIDPVNDSFLTRKGTLSSDWQDYLLDIAFQKMVVSKAFPEFEVKAHLVLIDKTSRCPTDKLNQKFRVKRSETQTIVYISSELSAEDLSAKILHIVNVDDICDGIFDGSAYSGNDGLSFDGMAYAYADNYARDIRIPPVLIRSCKTCEFRADDAQKAAGLRDGFRECWTEVLGWNHADFEEQTSLDVWNYHFTKKDKRITERRLKITDLTEEDISPKPDGKPGISASERQWMQVQKAIANDNSYYLDRDGLKKEMEKWTFPLHFIDFETSMPAIPFNKGRRPYEGIAFQYSHHVLYEDGTLEHRSEYLNAKPGVFPSFDFLRALKISLETDNGTIFRYSPHENTYLNMILTQMLDSREEFTDRKELAEFIKKISKSKKESAETWEGDRSMVDLWELVKRYYYDPFTLGSNSIKQVLPAILNRSEFLKEKYSKPIYGAEDGIKSLNFKDWTWVTFDGGKVIDPYKTLPKMFTDISDENFATLMSDSDELKDGGAALTAYAKLQFQEMSDYERSEIETALLKYCELDTLAMVMIYEGWRDLLG